MSTDLPHLFEEVCRFLEDEAGGYYACQTPQQLLWTRHQIAEALAGGRYLIRRDESDRIVLALCWQMVLPEDITRLKLREPVPHRPEGTVLFVTNLACANRVHPLYDGMPGVTRFLCTVPGKGVCFWRHDTRFYYYPGRTGGKEATHGGRHP